MDILDRIKRDADLRRRQEEKLQNERDGIVTGYRFTKAPREFIESLPDLVPKTVSKSEAKVLLYLLRFGGKPTETSRKTMAKLTGLSEATVARAVESLVRDNLVGRKTWSQHSVLDRQTRSHTKLWPRVHALNCLTPGDRRPQIGSVLRGASGKKPQSSRVPVSKSTAAGGGAGIQAPSSGHARSEVERAVPVSMKPETDTGASIQNAPDGHRERLDTERRSPSYRALSTTGRFAVSHVLASSVVPRKSSEPTLAANAPNPGEQGSGSPPEGGHAKGKTPSKGKPIKGSVVRRSNWDHFDELPDGVVDVEEETDERWEESDCGHLLAMRDEETTVAALAPAGSRLGSVVSGASRTSNQGESPQDLVATLPVGEGLREQTGP